MLKKFSEKIFSNRKLLILIAIANLAGFFAGIFFYWRQLMESSPILWIVILDSPISVLLFSIVCVLFYLRKRVPDILKLLASAYVIKYGFWTTLTIWLYWNNYIASGNQVLGGLNFLLHFLMIVEGVVLIPKISLNKTNTAIVLIILLVNDYFDYFLGTVTRIPLTHIEILMYESFLVSVLIVFSTLIYNSASKGSKSSSNP